MSRHNYTHDECEWLIVNSRAKKWNSVEDFTNSFNETFHLSILPDTLTVYMYRHGMPHIDCVTTDKQNTLTREQRKWIEDNCSLGIFKNKKHFIQTFNAVFNEDKTFDALSTYMAKNHIVLVTKATLPKYTDTQEQWLKDNYAKYEVVADLVKAYNNTFNTCVKHSTLTTRCVALGLHTYDKHRYNVGQFVKGKKYGAEECPIDTIRYDEQTKMCYIKVKMCEGMSRETSGHNYKAPFWKQLQNKVWEDNYGKVPDGYVACSLNQNPYEQDIKKIALIDKRGKCIMTRKDWWSENPKFTATAVRWCNLYFVAKDNGVYDDIMDETP